VGFRGYWWCAASEAVGREQRGFFESVFRIIVAVKRDSARLIPPQQSNGVSRLKPRCSNRLGSAPWEFRGWGQRIEGYVGRWGISGRKLRDLTDRWVEFSRPRIREYQRVGLGEFGRAWVNMVKTPVTDRDLVLWMWDSRGPTY